MVELVGSPFTECFAVDEQNVGELQCPIVGKLLAVENLVDFPLAFVETKIGQERSDLIRRGKRADCIEIEPSQKRGVVGQLGGHDTHLLQFGIHEIVNFVERRDLRIGIRCSGTRQ